MLIQSQAVEGEGSGQPTEPQHTFTTTSPSHVEPIPTIASSSHPKKTYKCRKTKRKAIEISQSSRPTTLVADETDYGERGDSMERAATIAISLDAEQGSGNIIKTQSMATLNEPIPQGTSSGSGPRHQDTILRDRTAQTRFESLPKQSNDPPLSRVNTLRSREDNMKLSELMEIYTKLPERVLSLENIKTTQDLEITNLKKRVKKLEKKRKSRTLQLKRRLFKFQEDAETQGRYGYDTEINTVSTSITTASINITTAELVISASAPVATAGVSVSTAEPIPPQQQLDLKDKGKGIMQEPEKLVKVKGKDQIEYDVDMAKRLQAELDEEVRLEREREEEASNAGLIEEWDTIKARIDADAQLAERLSRRERTDIC
ncbi:hypothetical protein Tco_1283817 [Tanacetum coccineum]